MSAVSVRIVRAEAAAAESSGAGPAACADGTCEAEADAFELPFFSGNPRVERVSGVVHLYRPTPAGVPASPPHAPSSSSPAAVALPVTDAVCALGVPGTLSVADFCQFLGAWLPRVRDMRLVRDERARGEDAFRYAALLRFDAPSAAEEFYRFYHGRAVRACARGAA